MGLAPTLYRTVLNRTFPLLFAINIAALVRLGGSIPGELQRLRFGFETVAFYIAAVLFTGFVHEASHALVARSYGVNVPSAGMMLFYFHPAFFVDVSGIRMLGKRGQRINVLMAGAMANNALATAALFLFFILPPDIRSWALAYAWMNIVLGLINVMPFIEYDGYHVLEILCGVDQLGLRAARALAGRGTGITFELKMFGALSAAFAAAAVVTAFVNLDRLAWRFIQSSIVHFVALTLMAAALVALGRRTLRKMTT